MKLWVDDLRPPPDNSWVWWKTSEQAIDDLILCSQGDGTIEVMSLDHDLGGLDTTRPVVLWCCENEWWPTEVRVHSMNPVGREWLTSMIVRYKP